MTPRRRKPPEDKAQAGRPRNLTIPEMLERAAAAHDGDGFLAIRDFELRESARRWFDQRPVEYNLDIAVMVCERLAIGATIAIACQSVGIDEQTYYVWQEQDRVFRRASQRARAEGAITSLVRLEKAGKSDWRAELSRLEKAFPEEYGPRLTITTRERKEIELRLVRRLELAMEHAGAPPELQDAVAQYLLGAGDEDVIQAEPA